MRVIHGTDNVIRV